MKYEYKLRVIFSINGTNVRFVKELMFPFPPTRDTEIHRDGKIINLGPFKKLHYHYNEQLFVGHMTWDPPYSEISPEDKKPVFEAVDQAIRNLTEEGWQRVD